MFLVLTSLKWFFGSVPPTILYNFSSSLLRFFLGTEVAGGAYFKNAERRTESCLMEAHTHKYIK